MLDLVARTLPSARRSALALALLAAPATAAAPVAGRWLTPERDSIVEIGPCGGNICGRVARVLRAPGGRIPTDANNPNPALRNRSVQGLVILTGFQPSGNEWRGRIYDPRAGKTYRSTLQRQPDGKLKVSGCIAFFCQSQLWTPAR